MGNTLYKISEDYLKILEKLEGDESIEPQILKDSLESIEGEFEVKADNYAKIIKELRAESEKYAAEIGRMQTRMETLANNEKRLKQYLYESMKATGKLKFKTDLFSFDIQKNGGLRPMEIIEGVEIAENYMKMIPDNSKIREALELGKNLPFAVLKEKGDHLVIR